ncbi:hypothetical protein JCM10213_006773 [Rhodosporidiobolus nylandii]
MSTATQSTSNSGTTATEASSALPASTTPSFTGDPLLPMPSAEVISLAPNVQIQPPLSRRGHGPGLLVVVPESAGLAQVEEENGTATEQKPLDPMPLVKWAEEGYAVLQVEYVEDAKLKDGEWGIERVLEDGVRWLTEMDECTSDKLGLIVYDPSALAKVLVGLLSYPNFRCLVTYGSSWMEPSLPTLQHLPASDPKAASATAIRGSSQRGAVGDQEQGAGEDNSSTPTATIETHVYPCESALFPLPNRRPSYAARAAAAAHSRALEFLKREKHVGGPRFDLETLWEEHCWYEFEARDLERTMATMVAEPYVNHVPVVTGGIGRDALTAFYRDHFIGKSGSGLQMQLVSRTVGVDRVIDEFVSTMAHDVEIDWMLPGIPPTGKRIEVPAVAIVCFRGDRLFHEHISWDQATVLKQLDLLPTHFPSSTGDTVKPLVRLPVAGAETAKKLLDEVGVPSNKMLEAGWAEET